VFRGTRARVGVWQGDAQGYCPELYVVPNRPGELGEVVQAVRKKIAVLQDRYAGVTAERADGKVHVAIPDRYRVGHEAHFAEVTKQFLKYVSRKEEVPAWENPNLLAKYAVTTRGVEQSRRA
jgi:hypothetical protein